MEKEECIDSEEEGKPDYRPGGYHPAYVGEIYNNKYVLLEKIGWGHFSTVWMTRNYETNKLYALKVQKSAEH